MYKLNSKTHSILKFVKSTIHWIKKKIILILVAFMIGLSNGMYEEDQMINNNQPKTEQEQKETDDDIFE